MDWTTVVSTLQTASKDSPFLVGGIGTVAFSGVLYQMRALPARIWFAGKTWLTSTASIDTTYQSSDELEWVSDLLHKNTRRSWIRNFSIIRGKLLPGFGNSWAKWNGTWIIYNKEMITEGFNTGVRINMTFITRSQNKIEEFLAASRPVQLPSISIRTTGRYIERPLRPWDSVFMDSEVKTALMAKYDWFKSNESWYIKHGLPYKFCVLIEGSPGVGKSSLITAFASHALMNIRYVENFWSIDTASSSNATASDSGFGNMDSKEMLVLEDVDTMGQLDREDATYDASRGKIIGQLLNLLDSGSTPWGLVCLITTNHPERLDSALKRPGRIDFTVKMSKLTQAEARRMFCSFYGDELGDAFDCTVKSVGWTNLSGAELQTLFYTPNYLTTLSLLKSELSRLKNT